MMVGTSQARLMLGFMITTMFLSMWISNTATTAMMLPIVDAVSEAINSKETELSTLAPIAKLDPIPENETVTNTNTNTETEEEEEYTDNPTHQLTVRSINEINELTVNSLSSLNPGNDPESMVAFLPNGEAGNYQKYNFHFVCFQ